MKLRRHKPLHPGSDYRRVWRLVDGAVRDTILQHPDYLTDEGKRYLRASINKRVAGAVMGYAEQSVWGRSGVNVASAADERLGECGAVGKAAPGVTPTLLAHVTRAMRLWAEGKPPSARSSAGRA